MSIIKDMLKAEFGPGYVDPNKLSNSDWISAFLIGESGTGKTMSFLSLPDLDSSVFIDCERGIATLSQASDISKLNIVRAYDWQDLSNILGRLAKKDEVKTIFIDSLTEANRWAKKDILKKMNKHEDEMSQYEWTAAMNRMVSFIMFIKNMEKRVIITCHTRDEKDEDDGVVIRRPSITGQLRTTVEREFDIILYSETGTKDKKTIYRWRTEKSIRYPAKDRYGKLPKPNMDQDWSEVFNRIG